MAEFEREDIERATGVAPRRFIRRLLYKSCYARTGMIDGVPVAMWGLLGTILSQSGEAWLSITPEGRHRPFIIAAVARAEAALLLTMKNELRSIVLIGDTRAERFLRFLGFEIGEISLSECGKMFRTAVLRP